MGMGLVTSRVSPGRLPAMAFSSFEGAMTALVTPLRDGKVDDKALAELVEQQIAGGIDALVAVGTTGESATLNFDEHIHVVAQTVRCARKRIPVIAGAGSNSTSEAIELAKAAREVGADGLLLVTPYYNRPSQEGLYRHFGAVVDAVPLPTIVYNVPTRTGCDLLPETVARLVDYPAVVGIKEATGSLPRATQILSKCGDRLAVLSGDDFTAMPLYAIGARGVISVVSNVAPQWMAEMWDAAKAGNWARARELHYKIQPLTELLFAEPSPGPSKTALAMLAEAGGSGRVMMTDEVRAPLYPISPALRERIRQALKDSGLL
jgi:4-hydroxy-tetrahydrodipicolinate synthase